MPHYDRCPAAVPTLARDVMAKFDRHLALIEEHVKIDFIFAFSNKTEPCITVHGMPARARAKITNLLDRIKGNADAEILLDGLWWEKASENQRMALLDHELYHLIVKRGKTDDARRPLLEMRKHDYQFGWFAVVARDWGKDASEVEQAQVIMDQDGQYFWPTIETPAQRFDP